MLGQVTGPIALAEKLGLPSRQALRLGLPRRFPRCSWAVLETQSIHCVVGGPQGRLLVVGAQTTSKGRLSYQMPEPPHLVPFDVEEQQL